MEGAARTRRTMRELVRTNDLVKLSWLQALLADAGIETVVLDVYTSVIEGSIGAIPRRLAVVEADFARARRVLEAAGEEIGDGGGDVELGQSNFCDGGEGGGEQHADGPPEHAPEDECEENDDGVQVERVAQDLRFDDAADGKLDGAGKGYGEKNALHGNVGGEQDDGQGD